MTLIVEDGTGISGANSYVDLVTMRAYASDRARSLPSADSAVEALMILATEWIETRPRQFMGVAVTAAQGLAWPRQDEWLPIEGLWINDVLIMPTDLPRQIKQAEMLLVTLVAANSIELFPVQTEPFVTSRKVDVIERHWSDRFGPLTDIVAPAVINLLRPLYGSGSVLANRAI